jgi:hypothetical protein
VAHGLVRHRNPICVARILWCATDEPFSTIVESKLAIEGKERVKPIDASS